MSSGKKHHQQFADLGVTADYYGPSAPPSAFTIPPPGHYLHDPHSPSEPPKWLVDSIREDGLIVPLVVKREGDKLMVDDGRTRVLAGLIVEAEQKRANDPPPMFRYVLLDGTDERADRAMRITNALRRFIGPATKAETIAALKVRSFPAARIAAQIGEPVSALDKLLVINDCCATVRALMEAGRLDWQFAPEFAKLSPQEQKDRAQAMTANGLTHGRKAREAVTGKRARRHEAPSRKALETLVKPVAAFDGHTGAGYSASERPQLVADTLAWASGDAKGLRRAWPEMAAYLDEQWKAASKPGRRRVTK